MKIAITTIGSRGDIQPYIALGKALKEDGHDVFIVTHPWAKELINSHHLPHKSIGKNIDIHYEARQFVEHATDNYKGLIFALKFIFTNLRDCHDDLMDILKDADLIVGHGIVGRSEADKLKKPFVTISIETMGLQKDYWKSKNVIKETVTYLSDLLGKVFARPYRNFRKEIGAPPLKSDNNYPYLAIVPISSFLQKHHPNWKEITEITGYFFAQKPENYKPPAELITFLESGKKPFLVTFGSMFHKPKDTLRIYRVISRAIADTHSRAVFIMPDLDPHKVDIPDYIFLANNIPYDWLLKKVSLVIHHFGFGTTAEALKAGLPSIPIPHLFDQKIRAGKIHNIGLASKPLDIKKLNSQQLTKSINYVMENAALRNRCKEIGMKISKEKGVEKAVELINNHIQKLNMIL